MNIICSLLVSVTVGLCMPSMAEQPYGYNYEKPLSSIPVPNAFRPEGIVRGVGSTAYVGSLENGSIYQVNLLTGKGSLLVERYDTVAAGLAYDSRSNYLYASGGDTGLLHVYDAADGQLKQTYQLTTEANFINDGFVTKDAAYFTNSLATEFYRLPLSEIGRLPDVDEVETIPLGDNFEFLEDSFNSNGIVATPDGKSLIIVNSSTGKLYKVNPLTGYSEEIILTNGDVIRGDGLVLRRNKLYVMQNQLNQIAEITLDRKVKTGRINRLITNDLFRVPATITSYRNSLYAINARFGVVVDENTDYDIVRAPLRW